MPRDLTVNLRRLSVTPATAVRYAEAFAFFMQFCTTMDIVLGAQPSDVLLDESLTDWIQFLWNSSSPHYWANLSYASCLDMFPRARLEASRRALKAWERLEPARAAFPAPLIVVLYVLYEVLLGENFNFPTTFDRKLQIAVYVCLLFLGLFRPVEIRHLRTTHVTLGPGGRVIIKVRGKTEIRLNLPSTVVEVRDVFVHILVSALLERRDPGTFLFECFTEATFGRFCERVCASTPGLPRMTPYSFKRGGASFLFSLWHSYDRVTEIGRWRSVGSARRYIDSARAESMVLEVNATLRSRLLNARAELRLFVRDAGGVGSFVFSEI